MENKKFDKVYVAIKVEDDLPPFPQIVPVLLDGRIPMMAQIRPSENGPEWWTLGMANATRIEEKKKCVTHWLKPLEEEVFTEDQFIEKIIEELPEYGIDTSMWEHDHGDCCYGGAIEFLARCIKGHKTEKEKE